MRASRPCHASTELSVKRVSVFAIEFQGVGDNAVLNRRLCHGSSSWTRRAIVRKYDGQHALRIVGCSTCLCYSSIQDFGIGIGLNYRVINIELQTLAHVLQFFRYIRATFLKIFIAEQMV